MATFPAYAQVVWPDVTEQHAPVMLRSEIERGMARQRRTAADAVVRLNVTVVFRMERRYADFESWFYAEGMGWFDLVHPRTGATVQARIVGGQLGALRRMGLLMWSMPLVLEYIRPGFVQLAPGLHTVDASRILSVQRNSTATYVDDAGVLQTAAANVLRYQGGQVLVEAESTNHLLQSRTVGGASWSVSNVSSAAGPSSIDGAASRTLTVTNTSNPVVYQSPSLASGAWVLSVVAKAGASSSLVLRVDSPAQIGATFDLSAGTVTAGAGVISSLGSGWFLCSLAVNAAVINAVLSLGSTVGNGVHVDMAQLEAGTEPSSRISTTTTAATRAADIVTVAA